MNGPWLRGLNNVSTKKIPKLEFFRFFLQLQKIVKPVKDIGLPAPTGSGIERHLFLTPPVIIIVLL